MKQLVTQAVILSRTDYGEADRILSLLTPDYGKLTLIAKGVRRIKSKLAGGIELFSVSEVTFIKGRSEVGTLISSRLIKHYQHIVIDLERTMLGYELIRRLHKATEAETEEAYFELIRSSFEALDDHDIPVGLIRIWFSMGLLRIGGHTPNLYSDTNGNKLTVEDRYTFGYDAATFTKHPEGHFTANHIKFLRLGFEGNGPAVLRQIQGSERLTEDVTQLVETMMSVYVRS